MSDPGLSHPELSQPGVVAATKRRRRRAPLLVGLLILIGGIAGGVACVAMASSQYEDAVANLQRAPVGCDTEFDFTGTGTFTFFIETKGTIGKLRGDCPNTETSYQRPPGADLPQVILTLVDADGTEVRLDRHSGTSYDAGGYAGTSTRTLTISKPAKYTLSVESDDTDFAIAVGRDPQSDYDQLRLIGMGVALGSLLIGGVLIAVGLRRRDASPPVPPPPSPSLWVPAGPYVPAPPIAPQPGSALPPPAWQPPRPPGFTGDASP